MKRCRAILFFLALFIGFPIDGSPVFRVKKIVVQPDGTNLAIHRQGDENFSYYATDDGVPVMESPSGGYNYAQKSLTGELVPSLIQAKERNLRTENEQAFARQKREELLAIIEGSKKQPFFRYALGDQKNASVNAIGVQDIPVILVQFSDIKFMPKTIDANPIDNVEFFNQHFNGIQYEKEGAGSVRDYFDAQSNGIFQPRFHIIGPITLNHERAYYGKNSGNNDRNAQGMITDAISIAIDEGVDFTPFIKNTNEISCTAVVFAGEGENVCADPNAVWSQYFKYMGYQTDGLKFSAALCVNEVADYYGDGLMPDGIGTFCHEFSHALGLPDFYPTNGLTLFGMDLWDIMDYGQYLNLGRSPIMYSAYEREFMGWMTIPILETEKQFIELAPLGSRGDNQAYKVTNDKNSDEYYILENHQPSNWFPISYGSGMFVYHIDYNQSAWTSNTVNNQKTHQRMTLIPADGILSSAMLDNPAPYTGDPYPGVTNNTTLSDLSTPSDTAYIGQYMHRLITEIQETEQGNISFCYMANGRLQPPVNLIATEITDTHFKLQWQKPNQAEAYVLNLKKGQTVIACDTITTPYFYYNQLSSGTQYSIDIYSISQTYIDSPIQTISVSTIPTAIQACTTDNDNDIKVYGMDAHRYNDSNLSSGFYVIKKGNYSYKIKLKK